MLAFTAELRVAGDDANEKGARVARVIRELDLTRVADSRIGGGQVHCTTSHSYYIPLPHTHSLPPRLTSPSLSLSLPVH